MFPTVAVPVYIPINSIQGFFFFDKKNPYQRPAKADFLKKFVHGDANRPIFWYSVYSLLCTLEETGEMSRRRIAADRAALASGPGGLRP